MTAATNATTRASHYFNEVIIGSTFFDAFQHFSCGSQSMHNSNLHFCLAYFNYSFTSLFHATHIFIFYISNFFSQNNFCYSTQCCFHYATGSAEDNRCTGTSSQRRIVVFFRQISKINTCFTNHTTKFSSGNYNIYITIAACAHFFTSCFCLFSSAGHYRNANDFGRIDACFFCIVSFSDSAKHLLRRFCSGKMR